MRTTLTLADDVLEAARSLAALRNLSLGEAVSELARRGLQARSPETSTHGLPVFAVSASAPVLTYEMVRQALDD